MGSLLSDLRQDGSNERGASECLDQDWRTNESSSGSDHISRSQSYMAYSTSGFITCVMADYIRRLGYPAKAHYGAFNYDVGERFRKKSQELDHRHPYQESSTTC